MALTLNPCETDFVKQILAKHYGTISLVSTDAATTFTVSLPLDFRRSPRDLDQAGD